MAYCTQCGAKLEPGAKFCSSCGTRVTSAPKPGRQEPKTAPKPASSPSGDTQAVQASDAPGIVTLSTWEVAPKPKQKPQQKKKNPAARPADKQPAEKEGRKIGCWVFILIFIVIPLLILLWGVVTGCSYTHTPPDPGTPVPAAHNGIFVCDRDTLWFNGDGKTVSWHFAQAVPELGEKGAGEYVFLFWRAAWRYDAAETFRIVNVSQGSAAHTFRLAGPASETEITLLCEDKQKPTSACFQRIQ